jgi:hypothetical protein
MLSKFKKNGNIVTIFK